MDSADIADSVYVHSGIVGSRALPFTLDSREPSSAMKKWFPTATSSCFAVARPMALGATKDAKSSPQSVKHARLSHYVS